MDISYECLRQAARFLLTAPGWTSCPGNRAVAELLNSIAENRSMHGAYADVIDRKARDIVATAVFVRDDIGGALTEEGHRSSETRIEKVLQHLSVSSMEDAMVGTGFDAIRDAIDEAM